MKIEKKPTEKSKRAGKKPRKKRGFFIEKVVKAVTAIA